MFCLFVLFDFQLPLQHIRPQGGVLVWYWVIFIAEIAPFIVWSGHSLICADHRFFSGVHMHMHTSVIWLREKFQHHLNCLEIVCMCWIYHSGCPQRSGYSHRPAQWGFSKFWTGIFSQQFLTVFDSLGCFPRDCFCLHLLSPRCKDVIEWTWVCISPIIPMKTQF